MGSTVIVCRKCKGHDCVLQFLEEMTDAEVQVVRCQKVCDGALVGLHVNGQMEWFARVAKPKPLVAIAAVLAGRGDARRLRKPLAKRRVRKLSGRPPRS